MEQQKKLIMLETLKHIPFDGWNMGSVNVACKALGIAPEYGSVLFPNGIREFITYFIKFIEEEMINKLEHVNLNEMKIRERIFLLVKARLDAYFPYKVAVSSLVTHFAYPANLPSGLRALWDAASQVWYIAGDKSLDYNYYTKRLILTAVYSSTLFYWLQDESKDQQETCEFLRKRIDNVLSVGSVIGRFKKSCEKVENVPFIRLLFRKRK